MKNPTGLIFRSGCKVNLYLRVGLRRPDGYHNLETLFLPLAEPHDRIEISPGGQGIESAFCAASDPAKPVPGIDPEKNTLTRAYAWHAEKTGCAPALSVRVRKGVPQGAGLGGGSANAAVLLRYLNKLAGSSALPEKDLVQGSAKVGADVPFFLLGRPAKASGVGEILEPAEPPFAGKALVLVCPDIAVSTAWAFSALDVARAQGPASAFRVKNPESEFSPLTSGWDRATYSLAQGTEPENDFEGIVFARFPELAELKEGLKSLGANPALLSGTGSSLFGIFDNAEQAERALKILAKDGRKVYFQQL